MTSDELLRLAASVEKGSEHPLGESIWAEATNRGLPLAEIFGFKATPDMVSKPRSKERSR